MKSYLKQFYLDLMTSKQWWLCLLCVSFLTLVFWCIGYANPQNIPDVKGMCVRGCEPNPPPSRMYRDTPAERPIKEPVYGPSPAEVKEANLRIQRAHRIKVDLKDKIIRLASPMNAEAPDTPVVVRPETSFFNLPAREEVILAAPLSGVKTPGSKIPMESLQRAVAILDSIAKAQQGVTDEDASFLAGQAALAMDGAPLQVVVTVPSIPRANEIETARQLASLTESIQKDRQELEAALTARLDAERQLKQKNNGDYTEYRQAFEREQKARASIIAKEAELEYKFKIVQKRQ